MSATVASPASATSTPAPRGHAGKALRVVVLECDADDTDLRALWTTEQAFPGTTFFGVHAGRARVVHDSTIELPR